MILLLDYNYDEDCNDDFDGDYDNSDLYTIQCLAHAGEYDEDDVDEEDDVDGEDDVGYDDDAGYDDDDEYADMYS